MDKYTASNGARIERDEKGWIQVDGAGFFEYIDRRAVDALSEFFRAERDEELGRWRWPENPGYVVYPVGSGTVVTVTKESNGNSGQFTRELLSGFGESLNTLDAGYSRAGRAYFDAHPERKPWEDAKPGEVWAITMDDGVEHDVFIHEDRVIGGRDGISAGGAYFDIDDGAGMTAARRIWPESD